jgi:hypothetical protein
VQDAPPPRRLPPPAPPGSAEDAVPHVLAVPPLRVPRPGEMTPAWRVVMILTWIGAFLAFVAVWKVSDELGLATWWLGPRSNPQPIPVRLVPFLICAVFGILASYHVRRLPWISLVGAGILTLLAVPDIGRVLGLAIIEFVIAAAVAIISLAALTGMYRGGQVPR